MTAKLITEIHAWIATEPDGGEGIIAQSMVIAGREMMVPAIGADMDRLRSLRAFAEQQHKISGYPIRLRRFVLVDEPPAEEFVKG